MKVSLKMLNRGNEKISLLKHLYAGIQIPAWVTASIVLLFLTVVITFLYSRSWDHGLFLKPVYKLTTEEKVVALTFDDGPSEERTPALQKVLDIHGVKATFFMLGENIEKYPEIAHAVVEQGHLIGNHSYAHPRLIFKSPAFITGQIVKTDQLIKSAGQEEIHYVRPPFTSKYVVLPLVLRSLGKQLVTGTYDPPSEYSSPYDAEKVAQEVIANTQPGSIIFLHDGKSSDQQQFVQSIEFIINGLEKKGYRFVRLDYKD
jgi:peptidoglycan/xylan/chitin deacetylase (PgdA/CDA1 family)